MGKLGREAVWGAALTLWMIVPSATASAASGSSKADKLLQQVSSGSPQRVIVRTRPDAKDRVKGKLPKRGRGPAEHKIISGFSAELDGREIAALLNDPDVLSVSSDADVTGLAKSSSNTTTDSTTTTSSYDGTTVSVLKKALGLENWFTGSSMAIAVIDSGVQASADFSGRIVGSFDFTAGRGPVAVTPTDEYGHGTHVAGLIGSSGASSNGKYGGVAPGIKILSLKVLDKKGSGKTTNVIAALEYAVATKDLYGTRIVNVSLGHPIFESAATDPLVQAVEAAVRSGLIVVTAAGNYGTNPSTGVTGYAGIASPGNAPSAITVGAASTAGTIGRGDDRVAGFSSRGPSWFDGLAKPDIVAPGFSLTSNEVDGSTLAIDYPSLVIREGSSKFLRLNGSSMATAVVSGLIAVMIEANNYGAYARWEATQANVRKNQRPPFPGAPSLTLNAIKAMLQYSATPLRDANGVAYDALTQGTGEVNGLGALALAYYADTTKVAGAFWMTTSLPATTSFGGVEQPWAQQIIWGTRLVHGVSLIDINQLAWAANLVWGTDEMDNLVWGTVDEDDNLVWGTSLDSGNLLAGASLFSGDALLDAENLVWGTSIDWDENLVWGTNLLGTFDGENLVWGTTIEDGLDNLVWGTLDDDNLVWGTSDNKVAVLGTSMGGEL